MTVSETKNCLACGKAVKGRVDKKFCDDYCRNNYNNVQKSKNSHSNFVRNINNALLKNRKILESILPETEEMAKTTHDKLLQKGFMFTYHTHIYKNKKNNSILFNTHINNSCFYEFNKLDLR